MIREADRQEECDQIQEVCDEKGRENVTRERERRGRWSEGEKGKVISDKEGGRECVIRPS